MEFTSAQLTSIIVAVITSTVSLLGAIVSAVLVYRAAIRKPADETKQPAAGKHQGDDKKPKKGLKRIYMVLLIAFLIGVVPGVNIIRRNYYSPSISVADPQNGQKVDGTIEVKGTYRNIDENRLAIWIAIYSYKDHLFFIQPSRADMVLEDQVWTNKETIIGTNSDSGAKFDIMVLLVDKKSGGYGEIKKYLNDVNGQGLTTLPDDIPIMKEITINRK